MIRWLNSLDEYREVARSSAGELPVLAPPAREQQLRWDEVLRTLYVPAPGPSAPGELVVVCGEELAPLARYFAGRKGARFLLSESPEATAAAIMAASEPCVVVLSLASGLKTGAVGRLVSTARLAGKQLGFLSGRTMSGLSFSIAKALMTPRPGLRGVEVFDAVEHRLDHSAPANHLTQRLRRPNSATVIRSHGEGSHAKLPGLTVCGLLDAVEFPDAPSQGCSWSERRCKRSPVGATDVVFGRELVSPVVFFVCCNGFNFAAELYPSPVSISLSLAEGWASAVVAPLRPLIAPDATFEAIQQHLSQGDSLGSIVDLLNEISEQLGQPNTFALHGDPQLRLSAPAAEPERQPECSPPRRKRESRPAEAADIQSWLVRLLRHAERGRRLTRSIGAWLGGEEQGVTEPATSLLTKVERLAIYALKRAEGQNVPHTDLVRATVPIRMLVRQWDSFVAELLLSMRERVDPFDVGHYDQQLVERRSGQPCRRCGTPLESYVYGRGEPEEEHRVAFLCCVCGPVSEHRVRGLALEVEESTPSGRGGENLLIRAQLRAPEGGEPLVGSTEVALRFFDKARNLCVHSVRRTVATATSVIDYSLPLPEGLSPDLHSIRLVAVSGFDVSYARLRFAGLPSPELSSCGGRGAGC
jgi:hypothetical protein